MTFRREPEWLLNWLRAPDQMLKDGDPIAVALYEKYNKLAMPNLRLNRQEAEDLVKFLRDETLRLAGTGKVGARPEETGPSSKDATLR